MFLKNITINNFKSIQKATVSFEPGLNIVIGKNGAGKSNLLQFINAYVDYFEINDRSKSSKNINLEYQFTISYYIATSNYELIIFLKRDKSILNGEIERSTEIKLTKIKDGSLVYDDKAITINEDRNDILNNNELKPFFKEMKFIINFKIIFVSFEIPFDPCWLDQPNKFEIEIELFEILDKNHDGQLDIISQLSNTIQMKFYNQEPLDFEKNTIDTVKEIFTKAFNDFNEQYQLNYYLQKYSPIQEIRINPNINIYQTDKKILVENLLIDFKVNDNWIPWSYLSDGSKRLFYLITQCLSLKDGLLLIEEPELGIHPHQLYGLMEFIKEQSLNKQIIISTHSPMVLDVLSPDELNRINIAKLTKEGTQFYKLDEEQIDTAHRYMSEVGELSYYWIHSDLENE